MSKAFRFCVESIKALGNTFPESWPPRAIMSGRPFKGMTRRLVTTDAIVLTCLTKHIEAGAAMVKVAGSDVVHRVESRYRVGDVCYINEAVEVAALYPAAKKAQIRYLADDDTRIVPIPEDMKPPKCGRYPGRVIPEAWARTERLEVMSLDIQPLRAITEEDAKLEGVNPSNDKANRGMPVWSYVAGYAELWNSLHAPKHGWNGGNWLVWVYGLKRIIPESETS